MMQVNSSPLRGGHHALADAIEAVDGGPCRHGLGRMLPLMVPRVSVHLSPSAAPKRPFQLWPNAEDAVDATNIRVALDRAAIGVENGKQIPLTPGMTVSAEVRTGTRRPIEYVLAPLQRYKDESGRER